MDSIKQYWRTWLWHDAVRRIITINFVVWLVISAMLLCIGNHRFVIGLFALPSSPMHLIPRSWTILTYMFTQVDFLHMLVNMMWLLVFGNIFQMTQGGTRLTALYIYGGIVGALVFWLANSSDGMMLGASCSVLAVIAAATMLMPKWNVNLLVFGEVRLLWLAVAAVVFFVVLSASVEQSVAHATGFAVGVVYGLLRQQGIDITMPFVRLVDWITGKHRLTARVQRTSRSDEQEFDDLLAKVGRSGYASLTASERQRLFFLSQKFKR